MDNVQNYDSYINVALEVISNIEKCKGQNAKCRWKCRSPYRKILAWKWNTIFTWARPQNERMLNCSQLQRCI
jgi:hypothetical protein